MTHFEQVTTLDKTKTFHIFRSKKPVASGDRLTFQTDTDEVTYTINAIHASPGLMKGWTAVGLKGEQQAGE